MIAPAYRILLRLLVACLILVTPTANAKSVAEDVYENVKDSIGTIYSINEEDKEESALGSGVAVTSSLVATNCHVALAGSFLILKINNETLLGRLFYYNQKKDFCLIEIVGSPLKVVKIRPSKSVRIGEDVFAIGNPEEHMKTISRGIISNKIKAGGIELLQTDASISHGSSGGGLFDTDGNLIGLTTGVHKTGENIAYAIPTEWILAIIGEQKKPDTIVNPPAQTLPENKPATISKPTDDEDYNKLTRIGYYGEDEIALLKWHGKCMIGITGRYRDKPSSLALWFPHAPDGLYIFSRVVNAENAIKFLDWMNEAKDVAYLDSKSFIYFDKELYPLPIVSINKVNQPVYLFVMSGEITEELIELDNFAGQFYRHTQANGMTTIKFGLSGFTEAYGAYSKQCK